MLNHEQQQPTVLEQALTDLHHVEPGLLQVRLKRDSLEVCVHPRLQLALACAAAT
jgi:hypothetical protein